jgi:hypothetical protein
MDGSAGNPDKRVGWRASHRPHKEIRRQQVVQHERGRAGLWAGRRDEATAEGFSRMHWAPPKQDGTSPTLVAAPHSLATLHCPCRPVQCRMAQASEQLALRSGAVAACVRYRNPARDHSQRTARQTGRRSEPQRPWPPGVAPQAVRTKRCTPSVSDSTALILAQTRPQAQHAPRKGEEADVGSAQGQIDMHCRFLAAKQTVELIADG